MRYLLPFFRVVACLDLAQATGSSQFVRTFDEVIDVVRHLIAATPVDQAWYLERYPDVSSAVGVNRLFKSAAHHFVTTGYFEGRLPFDPEAAEYEPPLAFSGVKRTLIAIPTRGRLMVEFTYGAFLETIRRLLTAVPVDADWYLNFYPEVGAAVAAGRFRSAREHFILSGYFENRLPYDMQVDEDWYATSYADLKAAQQVNPEFSPAGHFSHAGYKEGRRPRPDALQLLSSAL